MTDRVRQAALGAVPIAILVVAWAALTGSGLIPAALLPTPGAVLVRLAGSLADPGYLRETAVTLSRLFAGFALAFVAGVPLGILAGANRRAAAVVEPLVRILAPVPKVALFPALVLMFGFGSDAKVALVAADAVFPLLIATRHGAAAVDPKLVWSARAVGTSPRAVLFRIVLPSSLPAILTGSRIALVVGCVVVFLAEMIASTDGLGFVLVRAGRTFQTVVMFVPVLTISAIGLLLHLALLFLRRHLLRGFPDT